MLGEWIVCPTVREMLDDRLPEPFGARIGHAVERLFLTQSAHASLRFIIPIVQGLGGVRVRDGQVLIHL